MSEVTSSRDVHLQFLASLMPLDIGDRCECRTVGTEYEGVGEIIEISEELRNGGTPVHPAYLVKMEDQRELWFTEICLKRIRKKVS